jgi:iron complex outermembrane receptor protein
VNAAPAVQANCATLGVPASFTQINQQISVQTGGNEALEPETSETINIGFAYNPTWARDASWIEQLTFDVNYYDIKLESAIQALSAQIQLTNCVNSLSPLFCDGIVRGPGGSITAFANQLTNIGRIETDGFDWTVMLATPELGFGSLRFQWSNTYLAGYKEFTLGANGLVGTERAGIEVGSPTRGFVRYKSTLAADWLFHDFVTSLTLRYLSKLTETCPGALVDAGLETICSDPVGLLNEMDSRVYTDLRLSWTPPVFDQQLQVAVGVNNLLDEDPPPCLSCDLNNYDGTLYPVPGRFFHARAAFKF